MYIDRTVLPDMYDLLLPFRPALPCFVVFHRRPDTFLQYVAYVLLQYSV